MQSKFTTKASTSTRRWVQFNFIIIVYCSIIIGYTISAAWTFQTILCFPRCVFKGADVIYTLCWDAFPLFYPRFTLRAHDVSSPFDLLMMTIADELKWPVSMVAIETTNTLYVGDSNCSCIWKIDTINNIVEKWLSELGEEFSLSIANDNHLLVLKVSQYLQRLEIYDQNAKLVRSVLLPDDFVRPFHAISKPNGEFIVSHKIEGSHEMCVSLFSIELQIITQFRLKEAVDFKDVQVTFGGDSSGYVVSEMSGNKVYISDFDTQYWNLTDFRVIISNISETNVSYLDADGGTFEQFTMKYKRFWQFLELFWDSDDNNLFAVENVFGNVYLFETRSQHWSKIGLLRHYYYYFRLEHDGLQYDTKNKQFLLCRLDGVEIFALNKY